MVDGINNGGFYSSCFWDPMDLQNYASLSGMMGVVSIINKTAKTDDKIQTAFNKAWLFIEGAGEIRSSKVRNITLDQADKKDKDIDEELLRVSQIDESDKEKKKRDRKEEDKISKIESKFVKAAKRAIQKLAITDQVRHSLEEASVLWVEGHNVLVGRVACSIILHGSLQED